MITNFVRWTARVLSLGLVGLFAALVVGQGLPPLRPLSLMTLLICLLTIAHAGLLIAWRWELGGGLFGLAGTAGFYFVDFINSQFERFSGGWVFPLLFLAGLLYVLAATSPDVGKRADPRIKLSRQNLESYEI